MDHKALYNSFLQFGIPRCWRISFTPADCIVLRRSACKLLNNLAMTGDGSAKGYTSLIGAMAVLFREWQQRVDVHLFAFESLVWWRAGAAGGLMILFLGQAALAAEGVLQSEYEAKAAYLCKLANFVSWPTNGTRSAKDFVVMGILGDDCSGDAMEKAMRHQTIQDRRVIVRRGKDVGELRTCQILFICGTEKDRLLKILEELGERPVLTVSESEHFCHSGGMICLKQLGRKLQCELNRQAAERVHLRISSQLLKLSIASKEAGKERTN
jgi:YfiR/HmsC-like